MTKFVAIVEYNQYDPEAEDDPDLTDVYYLQAKTLEDARKETGSKLDRYMTVSECYMECEADSLPVSEVRILEVTAKHGFDLAGWLKQEQEAARIVEQEYILEKEAKKKQDQEEKDRKEFERLKEKFKNA